MITLEEFLREGCLDYYKIIKPRARDPRLWVLDCVTLYKIDQCWSWTVLLFAHAGGAGHVTVRSNGHVEIRTPNKTGVWGLEIEDVNNTVQDFINVVLERYPDIKTSGPQCDNYSTYVLMRKGRAVKEV